MVVKGGIYMEILLLITFWFSLIAMAVFGLTAVIQYIRKNQLQGKRKLKWMGISCAVTIVSFIGLGFIEGARQTKQIAEETITTTNQEALDEPKNNNYVTEKQDTENETNTTEEMHYLREEAVLRDVVYAVNDMKTSDTVSGYTSQSGTYLIVTLTVRNDSNEAISLNNGDFTVLIDGAEYEDDPTTSAYHDGGFLLSTLNPKMSKTASVVYEVPSNASEMPIILQIQPNVFKKDKLLIRLEERL